MIDLKKEREAAGLTQSQLAQKMGLSVRTIQDKEHNSNPTLNWLDKWAKALGKNLHIELK